jgi:hypothetical protein
MPASTAFFFRSELVPLCFTRRAHSRRNFHGHPPLTRGKYELRRKRFYAS